jgi:hypothetical protein
MTTKALKNKLDRMFSEYIRTRNAKNGYGFCISCGKAISYNQGDCGHYYNRKHNCLRYDEQNCNLQCRQCNRFSEGNIQGYTQGLIKKYGVEVLDLLAAKKEGHCKLGVFELTCLLEEYKEKRNKQKK